MTPGSLALAAVVHRPRHFLRYVAIVALLVTSRPADALFMQPTFVPVERLSQNLEAYLADHPRDALAYYNLGRLHYLAFANKSRLVPSVGGKDYPGVAADHLLGGDWLHYERDQAARAQALKEMEVHSVQDLPQEKTEPFYQRVAEVYQQLEQEGWTPQPIPEAELLRHALTAVSAFHQAIFLEPENGLFQLGLASLLESAADELHPQPALYRQMAEAAYLRAFELARDNDSQLETLPIAGLSSIVSYEAGRGVLRLADNSESEATKRIQQHLEHITSLRRGPITPIVFTLDQRAYAELTSRVIVRFDLDGDGSARPWYWVRPDVAILVWAPREATEIRSGYQLFGPVTFNQIWSNGYQALALLDDDQDRRLSLGELSEVRAWFDRNSNGQAETEELITLPSLGIESIATGCQPDAEGILHHPEGIRLKSGGTLPTWDWLAQPAEQP